MPRSRPCSANRGVLPNCLTDTTAVVDLCIPPDDFRGRVGEDHWYDTIALVRTQCNKGNPNEHNTSSLRYVGTFSSGPCPRLPSIRADTSKHECSALRPDRLLEALSRQCALDVRQVKPSQSAGVASHLLPAFSAPYSGPRRLGPPRPNPLKT